MEKLKTKKDRLIEESTLRHFHPSHNRIAIPLILFLVPAIVLGIIYIDVRSLESSNLLIQSNLSFDKSALIVDKIPNIK
jgi:hypothetical protein